jgi:hypothetical protein
MSNVVSFPRQTYSAKGFSVDVGNYTFLMSGTIDGFIDLVIPDGPTYPLGLEEAEAFCAALHWAIQDVRENCQYDRDPLLIK